MTFFKLIFGLFIVTIPAGLLTVAQTNIFKRNSSIDNNSQKLWMVTGSTKK